MNIKVLALDLEQTLIDDALDAQPRPGLREFLDFCDRRFARVALFTTVPEALAREVLQDLERRGHVPPSLLARLEFVHWSGVYKDLHFIADAAVDEILIVDDDSSWIRPDQGDRRIAIAHWDGEPDDELRRVREALEALEAGEAVAPAASRPAIHAPGA